MEEHPETQRYRVEKRGRGFWPYCVLAGNGTRELFVGHYSDCQRVASELETAYRDGIFVATARASVSGD